MYAIAGLAERSAAISYLKVGGWTPDALKNAAPNIRLPASTHGLCAKGSLLLHPRTGDPQR